MSVFHTLQTSFAAGELSPRLLGRGDLAAHANGAARLRNVVVHPTGGVSRRAGLRYLDTLPGPGRLVAFEASTDQVYLLAFTDLRADVYRDGARVATFATPWDEAALDGLNWVQSADALLVCHPDVTPRRITRTSDTDWTVAGWTFASEGSGLARIHQPHHRFADAAITLTPSATTGTITLTASAAVFAPGHVGVRFRLTDKEVEVTAVASPTGATATVRETLASTAATAAWTEQAFSPVRGWPVSCCFHQDRLVIGGGRDAPNRLWLSKSGDLLNFDLGTGLDDEAIAFAILSDQVNAIRAVFSGRHLQVFTSGAEWMVSGAPLTPGNFELHRQTRIGSPVGRTVPPRDVDGATLFVPRDGKGLREFLFADIEQAYQATDLAMLAPHLIDDPQDQDFDAPRRLFHMVMASGRLATLTVYRAEQVTAWTAQETDGAFLALAAAGGQVYVLVARAGGVFLEVFDDALGTDAAITGSDAVGKTVWGGLDHLDGETVAIVADGAVQGLRTVTGGAVTLDSPARTVEIGLAFAHVIEPLPVSGAGPRGGVQGGAVRAIAMTFRLQDTPALTLDTGRGPRAVPFRRFGAGALDQNPAPFTGDKTVRALGWKRSGIAPMWRIEQSTPLPFTLLSVAGELKRTT